MTDGESEGGTDQTRPTHRYGQVKIGSNRRQGRTDSATRALLIDAVQDLLVERGHEGVTSRKIGERAGVTHQTVFYYFKSLDDLFLALIARNAAVFQGRLDTALREEHPLRALWNIAKDRGSGAIELQLKAMAVHNSAVRLAMSENLETFRTKATAALTKAIGNAWPDQPYMAPALALIVESLGRYMVLDETMAISIGHEEAATAIEQFILQTEKIAR